MQRKYRLILSLSALLLMAASPGAHARGYASTGKCGIYPRLAITSPSGTCVGLIADEAHGLRFPRRVLEIAPGRIWVLDMGNWMPQVGQLIELRLPPDAATPANANTTARAVEARVLLSKLNYPSGMARGPDGKIYIGEADKIWRAAVPALGQPPQPEMLASGLPADGAHLLKELAFAPDGSLYVNMGSATDACRGEDQKQPVPCPERSTAMPRAAVWRLVLQAGKQPVKEFKPFASGLRNSMALAVMPDGPAAGTVWQGENNIDYRDPKQPPEELNLLRAGADYGWPYCIGARQNAQGYEKRFDCSRTEAPHMLWPAHVAPLQMLATPAGSAFGGQLLVAWHGQRADGQRLVGFARDGKGRPSGKPIQWLSNWDARHGLRPGGRPTGMDIDHAGRLLVVEDFNRSLLMLMSEAGTAPRPK